MCDKSHFQHEDNSRVTTHSDTNKHNNEGKREIAFFYNHYFELLKK